MQSEKKIKTNFATTTKSEKYFGVRHLQYAFYFVLLIVISGMRASLNIAVIAMISDEPPFNYIPTYPEWAGKKNIILSSLFWGYILPQISAGQIAKTYGPKLSLGITIFISSVFTCLIPLLGSQLGYEGVIASLIIQGIAQGFLFPSLHTLLSSWTIPSNRTKIGSFVYSGGPLGNVLAMPITGLISASSAGWPVVFYLYGSLGVIWSILWIFLGSDSPFTHKSITLAEKKYLEAGQSSNKAQTIPIPWRHILTSLPFWAIMVAHCGGNWGNITLLTEIPSYMENILGFTIASNSYLSALPYLVQLLMTFVMGPVANTLLLRNILTLGASRKTFNSIGFFIPAVSLVILNFLGTSNTVIIEIILVISVGFNAGSFCGHLVNHIDISPVHAGVLIGVTNTVANIFSMLAPLAVDAIKIVSGYEETDKALWDIVFLLASCVYTITGLFFVFAGSGKIQIWNNLENKNDDKEEGV